MRHKLFLFFLIPNISVSLLFEKDIQKAVETLKQQKQVIETVSKEFNSDKKAVLSLVFPEVIRYNAFKDFLETKSLEWVYVSYGKDKADFSIGLFQMKPSFIEKLENYIAATPSVKIRFLNILIDKNIDETAQRRLRVERLKQIDWQIRYAHVYYAVCEVLFKNENFNNFEEKIKFFAAAYNFGFDRDVKRIKQWSTTNAFPYGEHYSGKQMIYSELSIDFYKKYASQVLN